MSEAPAAVITNPSVSVKVESPTSLTKDRLVNPRSISKYTDPEGRVGLSAEVRQIRKESEETKAIIASTESQLNERQGSMLVRLKQKLNIVDEKTVELQTQILEAKTRRDELPDPKKMIEAYYEKVAEEPLSNQEKRDLLKPEVLAQLSTDEYVALWRRLNPYFLAHITRQGFRDHTGNNVMVSHYGGYNEFQKNFTDVLKNGKQLTPWLTLVGLSADDEASLKMFLSKNILQSASESEAKEKFEALFSNDMRAAAPLYPDKSAAAHLAAQIVSDRYYGGETGNEIFFVYPSDFLASQYTFAFNGWEKDFTAPQSEVKWNDVFIWTGDGKSGLPIDSGLVFLPEHVQVDPATGSRYMSEVKTIDGKEVRVMVEDEVLVQKFKEWATGLNDQSPLVRVIRDVKERRETHETFVTTLSRELVNIGISEESVAALLANGELRQDLYLFEDGTHAEKYIEDFMGTSAKWKKAVNTVAAKDYWEDFFASNPDLRPKHVVYYDGDPTNAVYRFQQEMGIGYSENSRNTGKLLGFDDHHIEDMEQDPRSNAGYQELVDLANRIIEDHYRNKV